MFPNDVGAAGAGRAARLNWPFSVASSPEAEAVAPAAVAEPDAPAAGIAEGPEADAPGAPPSNPAEGVHSITKTTDFWFDLEIARIEKKAVEEADQWAAAGLPRHDLRMDEPLPVESTLGTLCTELYRRWIERVKTKVQDAIEDSGQHAARAVGQLRFHLGSLSIAGREISRAEAELREVQAESGEREVRFGFPRLLSGWLFFPLIAFVTLVDWIANVPIFSELLPQEAGATELWATLMGDAEKYRLAAGLYRLYARIVFSPEVTLLALGVIAFLMFLCHALGEALRAWWSLRGEVRPRAVPLVTAYRKQRLPIIVASGLGVALVLVALWVSRQQIEVATARRYATAVAERDTVTAQLAQAQQSQDAEAMMALPEKLRTRQTAVGELELRAQYAQGIADMNWPVLILNIVLVLAATVASYLHSKADETNELGPDPRIAETKERLRELRRDQTEHRLALHQVDVEVQGHVARLNYLLRSDPLEGWEGKTERLRRVIPLFRAENARRRGMDPASIISFQSSFPLELPEVPKGQFFTVPPDLKDVLREFHELRPRAARAERGNVDSAAGEAA